MTVATPTLTGFNAISKTYGDAAFILTAPTTVSSGAFTYTSSNTAVATISGSTVTVVSVGTSTITATQAANGNYATASTTATLTVTTGSQATLTASASASSIVAITGTSTLSTSGGSGTGAVSYSSTGGCTISGTTLTAGATIGTCTVTATKAADSNYAVSTGTVNITVTAPISTLVSGGFTWTKNNSTVAGGVSNWTTANSTCVALRQGGFTWRLPSRTELSDLYTADKSALTTAGWELYNTWSSTLNRTNYYDAVNLFNGVFGYLVQSEKINVTCVHR